MRNPFRKTPVWFQLGVGTGCFVWLVMRWGLPGLGIGLTACALGLLKAWSETRTTTRGEGS